MSIHQASGPATVPGVVLGWLAPGPAPETGEYGVDWAGRIHEWQPVRDGWVLVPPPAVKPQVEPRVELEAG